MELKNQPVLFKKITLSSAEIQSLSTNPVRIINTPGPHKAIDILSVTGKYNFVSTVFTSTDLFIVTGGVSSPTNDFQFTFKNFLNQTVSFSGKGQSNTIGFISPHDETLKEDKPIFAKAKFDSAIGDGSVDLNVYYRIVNVPIII